MNKEEEGKAAMMALMSSMRHVIESNRSLAMQQAKLAAQMVAVSSRLEEVVVKLEELSARLDGEPRVPRDASGDLGAIGRAAIRGVMGGVWPGGAWPHQHSHWSLNRRSR